jgi:hypothetical protein
VQAILFTGAGQVAFSAGMNIEAFVGLTPARAHALIGDLAQVMRAIRHSPVVTVAAVNGYCLGAAFELALACDLRVVAPTASFGLPEIKVGVPSVIDAALLPAFVGLSKAREMILTGDIYTLDQLPPGSIANLVAEPGAPLGTLPPPKEYPAPPLATASENAFAQLRGMLPEVGLAQRSQCPVSELVLGTQCGGSDGYSGLTANPALGAAVDLLVAHGGTGILAETPEIYGAEHLLAGRAATPAVAAALANTIAWWQRYTAMHGGSMDNNPSPGNKDGGLTTILEKSLGAVAKGGTTPLRQVVGYAERPSERGLIFMDTPGYDPVSVIGLVAGGANLVCFTTGRGSVFGASRCRASSWPPAATSTSGCPATWISTAVSSLAARASPTSAPASSPSSSRSPRASPPRARHKASVTRNSCHGNSAPSCDTTLCVGVAHAGIIAGHCHSRQDRSAG